MAEDRDRLWRCNNCGHGDGSKPDRICNCKCHEAYDAGERAGFRKGIEEAITILYGKCERHVSLADRIAAAIRKLAGEEANL